MMQLSFELCMIQQRLFLCDIDSVTINTAGLLPITSSDTSSEILEQASVA
jgi:hypothetical protein